MPRCSTKLDTSALFFFSSPPSLSFRLWPWGKWAGFCFVLSSVLLFSSSAAACVLVAGSVLAACQSCKSNGGTHGEVFQLPPLPFPLSLTLLPEPWQIPARFYNISTFLNSHSHLHVRWHTLAHTDWHTHLSKPTACMFLMGGTKGYLMLTKI